VRGRSRGLSRLLLTVAVLAAILLALRQFGLIAPETGQVRPVDGGSQRVGDNGRAESTPQVRFTILDVLKGSLAAETIEFNGTLIDRTVAEKIKEISPAPTSTASSTTRFLCRSRARGMACQGPRLALIPLQRPLRACCMSATPTARTF